MAFNPRRPFRQTLGRGRDLGGGADHLASQQSGRHLATGERRPADTASGAGRDRPPARAIVCGQGALIEGDFQGLGHSDLEPDVSRHQFIDGVCLLVREPLDRFQEIITQSWKWRGGFCVPTDVTANPIVLPTASQAYWKRAVMIECL